jgi:molecular chaperone GrpE
MVKKKPAETEESKDKDNPEIIDNKDNKETEQVNDEYLNGNAPEEDPAQSAADYGATGETGSDKVVLDEKDYQVKLAEMQDRYLRLSAEFDNYRKRTLKEKMDISKYAAEDLLKKILPFMDDFERALKHVESSHDLAGVKEGIGLIFIKFSEFLTQNGIKEIEALNCIFNVDLHDAVAKISVDEEDKKGRIVDVVLKGYYIKDKVLRHSKVIIGE